MNIMNIMKLLMNLMKLWLCMAFCPKKRSKPTNELMRGEKSVEILDIVVMDQITVSTSVKDLSRITTCLT